MPRSNSRRRNETRQHRKENTTHTPIRETAINNQPAEKTQPNRDSTPSQPGPAGQFTTQEERGLPVRTTLDWLTSRQPVRPTRPDRHTSTPTAAGT